MSLDFPAVYFHGKHCIIYVNPCTAMFWSIAVCVAGVTCTGSNTECVPDADLVTCQCTQGYAFDSQGTIAVQGPSAEPCSVGKGYIS